jgi:hypothetical protein
MESADSSLFIRPALSAPRQITLRLNALWSSVRSGVDSLNDSWSADEVTLRAAKKQGEPGLANTGFVFTASHGRNRRYLKHYSAAYPLRRSGYHACRVTLLN